MEMRITGVDQVQRNLDTWYTGFLHRVRVAMEEIMAMLEGYAKTHHGKTPRAAGWVYLGTVERGERRGLREAAGIARFFGDSRRASRLKRSASTRGKRWREGGVGWGPVTGATDVSTRGFIAAATPLVITGVLSAGMAYDVFLELARKGKWSWLWPAVEANLAEIKRHLESIHV